MTFKDLNITEPILKAIEEKGYANPTPIQSKSNSCRLIFSRKSYDGFVTNRGLPLM